MMEAKHTPIASADEELDRIVGGGGTIGDVVLVKELGGNENLPNLRGQNYYFDGSDVGLSATSPRRS